MNIVAKEKETSHGFAMEICALQAQRQEKSAVNQIGTELVVNHIVHRISILQAHVFDYICSVEPIDYC